MDHSSMDHGSMDHSMMDHGSMDHSSMNHSSIDHSAMNHSTVDHSKMDHSKMDHSTMDHGSHSTLGHGSYFHASSSAIILFEPWQTNSWGGMLGSCIAIFIMAALYEGLKCLREYLLRRAASCQVSGPIAVPTTETNHVSTVQPCKSARMRMLSGAHLIQTLLHVIQVITSYFLMLIFMTYNVWLCMAVALGAGCGYFLFNWRRAIVVDINEHCH